MKPGRGGTSLVETLVTLWMIGVMLLLVAELAKDIQQESVYNKDHDQRMGAHQALDRIAQSMRSCYKLSEPGPSTSAPRVVMQSWNPQENSARLPTTLGVGPWSADDPSFLMARRFEVTSDGILLCITTRPSGSDSIRLLGELQSLQATGLGDGTFKLELKWQDSKTRLRSLVRFSSLVPQ